MQSEKYTHRLKSLIQAAQSLALRNGHQQFTPLHVLKALLEDEDRLAANLVEACGGQPSQLLQSVERELAKIPKVEGAGAGQIYLAPETARLFDQAEQLSQKAGDSFVTVEYLLLALALASGTSAAKILHEAGITAQTTRPSPICGRGERRTAPPPRRATMRSRSTRGISRKRRAKASSIRSSAATKRSGAPFRCWRGAPRTIPF
jgi:ATP-dependent Clp protease ATP-binding subunit ClpA